MLANLPEPYPALLTDTFSGRLCLTRWAGLAHGVSCDAGATRSARAGLLASGGFLSSGREGLPLRRARG